MDAVQQERAGDKVQYLHEASLRQTFYRWAGWKDRACDMLYVLWATFLSCEEERTQQQVLLTSMDLSAPSFYSLMFSLRGLQQMHLQVIFFHLAKMQTIVCNSGTSGGKL